MEPRPQSVLSGILGGDRRGDPLGPDGPVRPYVHLTHVTDYTGVDPLVDQARIAARVPLVPHLRRDTGFFGEASQHPRFGYGRRQRLLDVDMFAHFHGCFRDHGMGVVGCGGHDSVDVALTIEHLAEVTVPGG